MVKNECIRRLLLVFLGESGRRFDIPDAGSLCRGQQFRGMLGGIHPRRWTYIRTFQLYALDMEASVVSMKCSEEDCKKFKGKIEACEDCIGNTVDADGNLKVETEAIVHNPVYALPTLFNDGVTIHWNGTEVMRIIEKEGKLIGELLPNPPISFVRQDDGGSGTFEGSRQEPSTSSPTPTLPYEAHILLRCPKCKDSTINIIDSDSMHWKGCCGTCGKTLNILHWRGKMEEYEHYDRVLSLYYAKWFTKHGWEERKLGLWGRRTKTTVIYCHTNEGVLREFIFGTRRMPLLHTDEYKLAEKLLLPFLQRRVKSDTEAKEQSDSDKALQHYDLKYHESLIKEEPEDKNAEGDQRRSPSADSAFF